MGEGWRLAGLGEEDAMVDHPAESRSKGQGWRLVGLSKGDGRRGRTPAQDVLLVRSCECNSTRYGGADRPSTQQLPVGSINETQLLQAKGQLTANANGRVY